MLRVAIDDDEGKHTRFLELASDFIDKALGQGASVLVHCEFGISRSATIVVAQQMRKFGLSADRARARPAAHRLA